jgi:hypothetical protein
MELMKTQVGLQLIAQNRRMLERDLKDSLKTASLLSHLFGEGDPIELIDGWYPAPWRKGDPLSWKPIC